MRSGVKIMEFKVTGTIEAESREDAIRMIPKGLWVSVEEASITDVTLFKGGIEVKETDLSPADKETARRLSKGINVEGVARQSDVEKLAKWMEDVEKVIKLEEGNSVASLSVKPMASQEDFDKLYKRVEEAEAATAVVELLVSRLVSKIES